MTRRAATALLVTLFVIGGLLYFLFVLPRWWVLTGAIPSTLATAGRIAAGVPIALAAVPVVLTLQRSIRSAERAPELALRLRAWSALLLVIGGALILVAAIAEIWLGLGAAGPWLFAVYGAAAATAILGVLAFYLSYVAEKPPAEPKSPSAPKAATAKAARVKKDRRWRGKRGAAADEFDTGAEPDTRDETEAGAAADEADVTETSVDVEDTAVDAVSEATEVAATPGPVGLRNQRPAGKRHRSRRSNTTQL